jgi:two-component system, OmpR family, response regulator
VDEEPGPSARVLTVDADAEARAVLASALGRAGYPTSEASSGEEAIEIARYVLPALVSLEVSLPGICGYQVLHELRLEFGPALPVVFVSARTEASDRVAGLLLGADDYLVKPVSPDEFVLRVRRLVGRTKPIAPAVASRLTAREQEVLGLLAEGHDPEEIANRLFISRKTVGSHVEHIFRKLGVHSRAEAIVVAYRTSAV